jgi:pimeloyl-ACP methyl ester carboxylesterase
MQSRVSLCFALIVSGWPLLTGCRSSLPNPNFSCTAQEARSLIKAMQGDPKALERPLVIMSGWMDIGLTLQSIKSPFDRTFGREQILGIVFPGKHSFDRCRAKVIRDVDERFPSADLDETLEVDVVAFSMGGLVARYAALAQPGLRRLKIRRLFTISTPHQGADLAGIPHWDRRVLDMRKQSPFLTQLDQALPECGYALKCYVRLGDTLVGAQNAAPKGYRLWWIQNQPPDLPHTGAADDPCILADVMRQLRKEPALSTAIPTPLPR